MGTLTEGTVYVEAEWQEDQRGLVIKRDKGRLSARESFLGRCRVFTIAVPLAGTSTFSNCYNQQTPPLAPIAIGPLIDHTNSTAVMALTLSTKHMRLASWQSLKSVF